MDISVHEHFPQGAESNTGLMPACHTFVEEELVQACMSTRPRLVLAAYGRHPAETWCSTHKHCCFTRQWRLRDVE